MPHAPRPSPTGSLAGRLRGLLATSGFRGPVLTLLTGAGGTLVLSYAAQIILTRLYDPAAFGASDYFVTLLTILLTVAGLRYEDAVMQPEDDDAAAGVLGLAFGLVLATSAALLVLLPWQRPIAEALGVPALGPWLWLVPVTLVVMRAARLSELWLTRDRDYRLVSGAGFAGTAAMQGTRLGVGFGTAAPGTGGLVAGFAVGQAATAVLYGARLARRHGRALRAAVRVGAWRGLARRYRRFAAYGMPSALLGALVARLPVLLLPLFFDAATLGLYGRALVALFVPLGLIGNAVAQVFFVEAADAARSGRLGALAEGVHGRLVMVGLFPSLVVLVAGPDLFAFVFGAEWRAAGTYAGLVAPWLLLMSIASPLTRLFDVLERQRLELGLGLGLFAVQLAALLAGGTTGDVRTTLLLLGVVGALARAAQLVVLLRLAGVGVRAGIAPYLRYGGWALPFLVPLALVLPLGRPLVTSAVALAVGAAYAVLVVRREGLLRTQPRP